MSMAKITITIQQDDKKVEKVFSAENLYSIVTEYEYPRGTFQNFNTVIGEMLDSLDEF